MNLQTTENETTTFRALRDRLGSALRRTFVSIPTPSLVAAAYAANAQVKTGTGDTPTTATGSVRTTFSTPVTRTGAYRVA